MYGFCKIRMKKIRKTIMSWHIKYNNIILFAKYVIHRIVCLHFIKLLIKDINNVRGGGRIVIVTPYVVFAIKRPFQFGKPKPLTK